MLLEALNLITWLEMYRKQEVSGESGRMAQRAMVKHGSLLNSMMSAKE